MLTSQPKPITSMNIFGDQSSDTNSWLADFSRIGSPEVVARAFLERSGAELRNEIDQLPKPERAKIPIFRTLYELNKAYNAQNRRHVGIDSALLCIAQIAHQIDKTQKTPQDMVSNEHTYNVGLCTGQFAAAAAAMASSPSHLVRIGLLAVVFAFRLGTYVNTLANEIAPVNDDEKSLSWSHLVPNSTSEETEAILAKFHAEHNITAANRVYVSAVSTNAITISGNPLTLGKIGSAKIFQGRLTSIPVYGPFHAAHLYKGADIDSILGLNDAKTIADLSEFSLKMPLLSASTGTWFPKMHSEDVFRAVALECLTEPLLLNKTLEGCANAVTSVDAAETVLIPLGPTISGPAFARFIQTNTNSTVTLQSTTHKKDGFTGALGAHGNTLGREKLAIVGMAGRFPDSESLEKLWELLAKGLDVHKAVPANRFPVDSHVDPAGKVRNTSHTPYGCWIPNPEMFDARFFNMSPREAFQTCPMQRIGIESAYEALEMSGYQPNRTPSTRLDRIGTFYGQTSDDWRELNAAQDVDTYFITGGVRAFGPGRINYHFGFSGPSLNIDTACSSSAAALQVACTSLWSRECDTAIVGGLNCMTNSDIFAGLSRGQFLSKTGGCKTFDDEADGYCRGDGCASVIVKRLADAEADNDRVLGVILGTATNHSADAISITHPHGPTQSILSRSILDAAGVDPHDVDYVEMHGTGTQAGDGTEMVSVTDVFAPADRHRPKDRPLYLGSVKANVGHGEAASGITALCKVLSMMKHNAIPPHVGIKGKINHSFPADLGDRGVNIAFHLTPFKRSDGGLRRVFINNFSAAGGNTGILLEDAPVREAPEVDTRPLQLVAVTGKSRVSMVNNIANLVSWLKSNPDIPLSHVAYTTTARRIQHYWRSNVVASSTEDAILQLEGCLEQEHVPVSAKAPQIVFCFTGQGSHYAGIGQQLYADYAVFRTAIDEFIRLAEIHGFPSFLPLIDGSEPDVNILSPVIIQLGLCAFEMALFRLWQSWDITPSAVIGHSLGEYAALYAAGVLSASDTIYLVGARAELLVSKCTAFAQSMVAVAAGLPAVGDILNSTMPGYNVACVNGPRESVITGTLAEMEKAVKLLTDANLRSTQLKVPFAFHSEQVDPILDEFEELAHSVTFHEPTINIISPLAGRVVEHSEITPAYLRKHAREPVNFHGAIVDAKDTNVIDDKTIFLEIGPHPVNVNLVKSILGPQALSLPTLRRKEDTYKTLLGTLSQLHTAGVAFNFDQFHRDFVDCLRVCDLPAYAWDHKPYWIQYTGDWNLTKGGGPVAASAVGPVKPTLNTTSVHKIESEEIKGKVLTLVTSTDLGREDTRPILEGHLCNGAALCPSTLYADICMTVADYSYRALVPDAPARLGLEVCKVDVPKTLILDEHKPQTLIVTAVTNLDKKTTELLFSTTQGGRKTDHATCTVVIGDIADYTYAFQKSSLLVNSRIQTLETKKQGVSHLDRGMAYKLFKALVDYSPRYRGMEHVIVDANTHEAVADIKFQTKDSDGKFFFNPYWIDSCCHVSGFICNGAGDVDSVNNVYISHGWGSLQLPIDLDATKTYRTYIQMQPVENSTVVAGDAYILDGEKIIGMCKDIRFQCIPRRVLDMMLPPRGGVAGARRPAAPAKAVAAPVAAKKGKAPKAKPAKAKSSKAKSVVSSILSILAREVGVGAEELADNVEFADLGVDSLMGLTVAGCIREELDIDIDNNIFQDYSSISKFKQYMSKYESGDVAEGSESGGDSASSTSLTITTPEDSETSDDEDDAVPASAGGDVQRIFRETIAAEMGVDIGELIAAPDLAGMGMDSLMTLTILGALRDLTGVDYPADVFTEHQTLDAVEKALGISAAPAAPPKKKAEKSKKSASPAKTPSLAESAVIVPKVQPPRVINTHPGNTTATIHKDPRPTGPFVDQYPERKAGIVNLQGSRLTAKRMLWMVPDGSGSATSYTEISKIGPEWVVYGLNSAFMLQPELFTCGVYGMAAKFVEAIKSKQPKGPYALAGWSAGGVIAFEAINQLIKAGDEVSDLIIIDAPCPVTIEPLPKSLHAWFADLGILGEKGKKGKLEIPDWLLPHFAASVTALSNYTAEPLPHDKCPNVTIIWCEDGVCKTPSDPRPDPYPTGHALFLLDNRTDFGPNRWDEFLRWDKITTYHMPGNHFTMMKGEGAKQLGVFMSKALH